MNSEEFVVIIKEIKDYWLKQTEVETLSAEEAIDGVCFTILNLLDGSSGRTDFKQILLSTKDSKHFNKDKFLHEMYCALCEQERLALSPYVGKWKVDYTAYKEGKQFEFTDIIQANDAKDALNKITEKCSRNYSVAYFKKVSKIDNNEEETETNNKNNIWRNL